MRNKHALGLDIGSHTIKLVELTQSKSGLELQRFGVTDVPPDAIVEGNFMNFPLIVERVRSLVKSQKVKQKKVALAISGNSVIVKKISLPEMSQEELEESVQWEAEQYIPFDIKDVINANASFIDDFMVCIKKILI